MKKIFSLILLATLFVACGDDKEDEPEYLDPTLIEGTWMFRTHTTDDEYHVFKSDGTYIHFFKDRYDGDISTKWNYKDYKITTDKIYYTTSNGVTPFTPYILEGDSILKMKFSENGNFISYKKVKSVE